LILLDDGIIGGFATYSRNQGINTFINRKIILQINKIYVLDRIVNTR